ncbi:MAG: Teichoic acid linkage unit synthesis [Clostridiales bacterium]|nr:Teichoic acid linkage unit synthesis [Clostridiales bacterium]
MTASPPSLGIGFSFILLFSGLSIAPSFFANFIVRGVITNAVINASKNAIDMSPHINFTSFIILV